MKKCCDAHIEYCKGTIKQNIEYIRKDGNILDEIGEVPRERGGSHTVKELKQIDTPDDLDWKEYNTWNIPFCQNFLLHNNCIQTFHLN